LYVSALPARAQAAATTIGGVSFLARADVAGEPLQLNGVGMRASGEPLQLNGVGMRASAMLKGFAAALYLPQPARSAEQALQPAGAKRLRMRMLLDVPTELFAYTIRKYVRRNVPEAQQSALQDRLGAFDASLRAVGQVRNGDTIDLDFVPGSGLVLAINGRPRSAPIPGADLYAAVMQVFIGERPVDVKLKAGLLGQRAA
jgi:hypothetical protein